jgi:hypothetical protein
MRRNLQTIFFILFLVVLLSCTDNRCNESTDVELKAEVFVDDPTLINAKFLDSLSVYSPDWIDSVHYSTATYMLELYPNKDTTIFVFTSQSWIDTVWVIYSRQLVFFSQECGFVTNYKIDTALYTNNNIDSLIWVNKKLTTQNDGHVKIYF